MTIKANILLGFLILLLSGCSVSTSYGHIRNPPTKSFVKILHTIEVKSCSDPKDKNCPLGVHARSGSGMAIKLINGHMTVLTAGHVCDAGPTKALKEYNQTVMVVDHNSDIHQAWPILISQNNSKGAPDACILYVPTLNVKQVIFSRKKPNIGEELYYIGAPLGIYHPPNALIFKGIYSGKANASTALITAPAIGGSSGSAVINMKNEIVGLIWGSNLRFPHASVMTNHRAFILFLDAAKKKLLKDLKK